MYLLRLSTEVDWESEKECFQTLCRETARFYAIPKDLLEDEEEEQVRFKSFNYN